MTVADLVVAPDVLRASVTRIVSRRRSKKEPGGAAAKLRRRGMLTESQISNLSLSFPGCLRPLNLWLSSNSGFVSLPTVFVWNFSNLHSI